MALSIVEYTGSSVTVGATEVSLTAGSTVIQTRTVVGIFQVFIDVNAIASGDEFEVALYEKALAAGTQRRLILGTLTFPQADPLWIAGPFHLGAGWDFGLKKIAGTDRAFSWSVRSVK